MRQSNTSVRPVSVLVSRKYFQPLIAAADPDRFSSYGIRSSGVNTGYSTMASTEASAGTSNSAGASAEFGTSGEFFYVLPYCPLIHTL